MDNDFDMPAKRAKFDVPMTNLRYGRIQEKEIPKNKNMQYDDPWGDDFAEEDIKEMDFVASQACLLEGNVLDNSKLGNNLHLMKSKILEKPAAIASITNYNDISQLKLSIPVEKSNLLLKKSVQGTSRVSQDIADINYSQFKNKLIVKKDHNSTFQKERNFIIPGNLLARCKQLESGNIKIRELQSLHTNNFLNKSKCNTSNNWPTNIDKNLTEVKDVCIQTNIYMKTDYQLKTCNTYFSLARISELMFGASVPEKPIINVKVIEKTGKRNLPILQEEERFRIFENPDLVKPVVTIVDGKKLTTEFVLLELAAIERKINAEIESESYTPIINKVLKINI
ncbi:hypothetical protein EAI_06127 [Harpegnathos saltator]|uniref:Uncharacterized protein n=1 Tax=Harpegnathos saltator TaxID=610380 RepID=E2C9K5_HARSA|nr:hypothetical protein EAI_06127 [Harpegnathos saltator]